MIVVSDTSPINYLTLIGHVELLKALFGEIVVPASVFQELSADGAPTEVQRLLRTRPEWLRVVEIEARNATGLARLDRGERDAILLGMELQAQFVLIDEARGREAAIACGLSVIGVIGVLERAVRKGLVNGPEVVAKLNGTSFRATPKLLAMLSGAGVNPEPPHE